MARITKRDARLRRHRRVRGKVAGTAARPRLAVFRSNAAIYAQIIDDEHGPHARGGVDSRSVARRRQERPRQGGRQAARRAGEGGGSRGASSSTAAATCTTAVSRRSPTARAREDCTSRWAADAARSGTAASSRSAWSRSTASRRSSRAAVASPSPPWWSSATRSTRSASATARPTRSRSPSRRRSRTRRRTCSRCRSTTNTITHEVLGVFGAGRVMLKPASPGTGVIAGAGARAVLELAGLRDVLAKSLGTSNPINLCRATETALRNLRRPEDVAKLRGKRVDEILPRRVRPPSRRPRPSRSRLMAQVTVTQVQVVDPRPARAPRHAAGAGPRAHRQEPRARGLAVAARHAAPGRLPRARRAAGELT